MRSIRSGRPTAGGSHSLPSSKLKTLDTAAGLPQVIGDARNGRGGSWGDDDVILFAPTGGGTIFRVPASGGDAKVVTRLDTGRGENAHYWPVVLPGSRKFLYFVRSFRPENNGIYIAAMDGRAPRASSPRCPAASTRLRSTGCPVISCGCRMTILLAQPFDPERGVLSGQPARIASGVRVLEAQRGLLASVSRTGAVAWAPARAELARFAWLDRDGRRRRHGADRRRRPPAAGSRPKAAGSSIPAPPRHGRHLSP